jgi:hypothetical protein
MFPEIEAWDQAPEGSVMTVDGDSAIKEFRQTDAIICRVNAPNISRLPLHRGRDSLPGPGPGHRLPAAPEFSICPNRLI